MKLYLTTILASLFLSQASYGQSRKVIPAGNDLVVTAFEMGFYFGQINDKVEPELDRQTKEQVINATQAKKIRSYIKRIFVRSNLSNFAAKTVASKMDVNVLQKFRGWFSKPIGQKLYDAFAARENPNYKLEKDKYFITYGQAKIKNNRINVIRTYLINSKTLENIATAELGARYAIDMGRDGLRPKGTQERPLSVYNRLKPIQSYYLTKPTDELLKDYIYLFRNLTNREIDSYSKFLTTPLGAKIVAGANEAFTLTIQQAGATVSNRIVKERSSTYIPDL